VITDPMKHLLLVVLAGVVVSSCTIVNQGAPPPKTQLQIREFQTREFDTNDVKLVMKAVINVLQDEGFVVKNAVMDLGLITASKELQLSGASSSSSSTDYWSDVFAKMFGGSSKNSRSSNEQPRFNKFKVVEASVNVSEMGSRCRIRANFLAKVLDNQGDPSEVYTIDDAKFYQDFFSKVDKGVFLQRQGL
jgi:hypothetical protein